MRPDRGWKPASEKSRGQNRQNPFSPYQRRHWSSQRAIAGLANADLQPAEMSMNKTMYVYDSDKQIARITGTSSEQCLAVFEHHYGSNDYTCDTHGNDLCACEEIDAAEYDLPK
jgi:hypothetical protein